jgi:hypothetical protein
MRIHITLSNVTETQAVLDKAVELGLTLISSDAGDIILSKSLVEPISPDEVQELYTGELQGLDSACWSTTVVEN